MVLYEVSDAMQENGDIYMYTHSIDAWPCIPCICFLGCMGMVRSLMWPLILLVMMHVMTSTARNADHRGHLLIPRQSCLETPQSHDMKSAAVGYHRGTTLAGHRWLLPRSDEFSRTMLMILRSIWFATDQRAHPLPGAPLSTKYGRQST